MLVRNGKKEVKKKHYMLPVDFSSYNETRNMQNKLASRSIIIASNDNLNNSRLRVI